MESGPDGTRRRCTCLLRFMACGCHWSGAMTGQGRGGRGQSRLDGLGRAALRGRRRKSMSRSGASLRTADAAQGASLAPTASDRLTRLRSTHPVDAPELDVRRLPLVAWQGSALLRGVAPKSPRSRRSVNPASKWGCSRRWSVAKHRGGRVVFAHRTAGLTCARCDRLICGLVSQEGMARRPRRWCRRGRLVPCRGGCGRACRATRGQTDMRGLVTA